MRVLLPRRPAFAGGSSGLRGAVIVRQECCWDVQAASLGSDGGERSGVGVELDENVFDVGGDGPRGDAEASGGLGVVQTGGQQAE